jgi:type I restriction enzyme M protein
VLTNPPFGIKGSIAKQGKRGSDLDPGVVRRDFVAVTSNKQLNFVQHVMSLLKPGGRAAMIVPDNVLFEAGVAAAIRRRLLEVWSLHTIIRLPAGLFYAQGVKANVIFFDAVLPSANHRVWVYDMRVGAKFSLRTRPLRRQDLDEFVDCYHSRSRSSRRQVAVPDVAARWSPFPAADILRDKDCSLDLGREHIVVQDDLNVGGRLQEISSLIAADLRRALDRIVDVAAPTHPDVNIVGDVASLPHKLQSRTK